MGETTLTGIRPRFNRAVKLTDQQSLWLSSNSGAIAGREILHASGIVSYMAQRLVDPREAAKVKYSTEELLRLLILMQGLGYGDQSDVDRLSGDPALRVSADSRSGTAPVEQGSRLPSQPTLSRSVEMLSNRHNQEVLRDGLVELAALRRDRRKINCLDIDSTPCRVHGNQPGGEFNGHYHQRIYHALMAIDGECGDMLAATLRPGNVHTAQGAGEFIIDTVRNIARHSDGPPRLVRMDAGFSGNDLLEYLESHGMKYLCRLPSNQRLERMGRPYKDHSQQELVRVREMRYKANSWKSSRRVLMVTVRRRRERDGQLEMFVETFWLVTNIRSLYSCRQVFAMAMSGQWLLKTYRGRGKAEGHIGELKDVLSPSLSSTWRPKSRYRGRPLEPGARRKECEGVHPHNETLFLLNLLAYGMLHAGRCVMEEETNEGWSIKRFRERVLCVASRMVRHARSLYFVIEPSAVPYWNALWRGLGRLRFEGG